MPTFKPSTQPQPEQDIQKDVPPKPKPTGNIRYPFWFGGSAASMAAVVTHPLDLVKVRLQTRSGSAPKTMTGTFTHILKSEGPLGLYDGLTAALLRQLTYSTVRFGVYEELKVRYAPPRDPLNPKKRTQAPFSHLVLMSCLSGLLGGIAGNPADVLNVRMQSDASLPLEKQRNYKHALDGLIRMTREEGFPSLFRGVTANSLRALLMTSSQLASYDAFKSLLLSSPVLHLKDNTTTHFLASFLAGFVATTICSPVDVIKTRIMSGGGKISIMQIFAKAQREEGLLWIFKGWVPSFIRLGPQTICTMLFLEQHKKVWRRWRGEDED